MIAFDTIRNEIRSFNIAFMKNIYILSKVFKTCDFLEEKLQSYLEEYNYDDSNILKIDKMEEKVNEKQK